MKHQIKELNTDDLIPYINNSRTHDESQVNQIAASIKEFGFLNPVIVDAEHGIIAGHGRVMAAKKLNLKTVPCLEASHLSEAQKKAYIIADNKLALNSDWDNEVLRVEFEALKELDFDLTLTGFNSDELAQLSDDLEIEEEKQSDGESYSEAYSIVIDCIDEEEQEALYNEFKSRGLRCQVQSL